METWNPGQIARQLIERRSADAFSVHQELSTGESETESDWELRAIVARALNEELKKWRINYGLSRTTMLPLQTAKTLCRQIAGNYGWSVRPD